MVQCLVKLDIGQCNIFTTNNRLDLISINLVYLKHYDKPISPKSLGKDDLGIIVSFLIK